MGYSSRFFKRKKEKHSVYNASGLRHVLYCFINNIFRLGMLMLSPID